MNQIQITQQRNTNVHFDDKVDNLCNQVATALANLNVAPDNDAQPAYCQVQRAQRMLEQVKALGLDYNRMEVVLIQLTTAHRIAPDEISVKTALDSAWDIFVDLPIGYRLGSVTPNDETGADND